MSAELRASSQSICPYAVIIKVENNVTEFTGIAEFSMKCYYWSTYLGRDEG